MTHGAQSQNQPDRAALPGWIRTCMVLIGVALLIGPMLAVVWPR